MKAVIIDPVGPPRVADIPSDGDIAAMLGSEPVVVPVGVNARAHVRQYSDDRARRREFNPVATLYLRSKAEGRGDVQASGPVIVTGVSDDGVHSANTPAGVITTVDCVYGSFVDLLEGRARDGSPRRLP